MHALVVAVMNAVISVWLIALPHALDIALVAPALVVDVVLTAVNYHALMDAMEVVATHALYVVAALEHVRHQVLVNH